MKKKKRKMWKRLRRLDITGPLESYFPLGHPSLTICDDDSTLENRYLETPGLYYDVEKEGEV